MLVKGWIFWVGVSVMVWLDGCYSYRLEPERMVLLFQPSRCDVHRLFQSEWLICLLGLDYETFNDHDKVIKADLLSHGNSASVTALSCLL